MKTFLVGGAVRDKLLGIPVKDRDWVVTGSTPDEMQLKGFEPVGKDFPVFLHPKTKEEYALARTERKSGHGYTGFVFHTDPDVTLEDDLIRRDLTINAIAEDEQGNLIDPYQGQQDILDKILRHVSPAFQEDPLRILRVARFYARLKPLGFNIAGETMILMKKMVDDGEANHLVAERVWQETIRALMEASPEAYFEVLQQCGALPVIMPELAVLLESNSNLKLLQKAAQQKASDLVRFGCLFAGKPEQLSNLKDMAKRMRLPAPFAEMAGLVLQHAEFAKVTLQNPNAESWMTLYEKTDAIRRPERFADFLICVSKIVENDLEPSLFQLANQQLKECRVMNARAIVQQGFKGKEVGEQLRIARLKKLQESLENASKQFD